MHVVIWIHFNGLEKKLAYKQKSWIKTFYFYVEKMIGRKSVNSDFSLSWDIAETVVNLKFLFYSSLCPHSFSNTNSSISFESHQTPCSSSGPAILWFTKEFPKRRRPEWLRINTIICFPYLNWFSEKLNAWRCCKLFVSVQFTVP